MAGRAVEYCIESAQGLLVSAGLATVSELEDYDGIWSLDMYALYIPVAIENKLNEQLGARNAVAGAIAQAMPRKKGSKVGKDAMEKDLAATRREIRRMKLVNRGFLPEELAEEEGAGRTDADEIVRVFRNMGLNMG